MIGSRYRGVGESDDSLMDEFKKRGKDSDKITARPPLSPTRPLYLIFKDESRPRGGFIHAETLVLNGTAGDNSTAGGTLKQPVQGFLVG